MYYQKVVKYNQLTTSLQPIYNQLTTFIQLSGGSAQPLYNQSSQIAC